MADTASCPPAVTKQAGMAARKKAAPRTRKRASSGVRSKIKSRAGGIAGFLRAFVLSAAASFGVASYALHAHLPGRWHPDSGLGQALSSLVPDWLPFEPAQAAAPLASATGELVQTRFDACRQFFPAQQPPVVPASQPMRELCFSAFAVLHGGQTRTPVLVAQRLNRRMIAQASAVPRTDRFHAEARLPRSERAGLDDYRGSGYSRGHMAPAGDMHDETAMAQSFSLANIVPQDPAHNSGPWNRIEQDTRKYVQRAAGDVYVFTGPVYAERPQTLGQGRVAVPSHLYKVVYDATSGRAWVHWQANSPDAKAERPIGYDEFVRRTGLRLLPAS